MWTSHSHTFNISPLLKTLMLAYFLSPSSSGRNEEMKGLSTVKKYVQKSTLHSFSLLQSVKILVRMFFRSESCWYTIPHVSSLLHRLASVCTTAANWSMATTLPCSYTSSILDLCERPWARGAFAAVTSSWEIVKCCVPRGAVAQRCARASRQLWDR